VSDAGILGLREAALVYAGSTRMCSDEMALWQAADAYVRSRTWPHGPEGRLRLEIANLREIIADRLPDVEPREGPNECAICGAESGQRHVELSHYAEGMRQVIDLRFHRDGSACACDPRCDCHPPERSESTAEITRRGSVHLETCPAFALGWSAR
jgi:hypothetical protein